MNADQEEYRNRFVEDCIYAYDCNITYARSWRCTG